MRTRWTALALLTFALGALLAAPMPALAQAQAATAGAAPVDVLSEGAGDVQVEVAGQPGPSVPQGRFAALDLVSARVWESAASLAFQVGVADLDAQDELPFAESGRVSVDFRHNDAVYRVHFMRSRVETADYYAQFEAWDSGLRRYFPVAVLDELTVDAAAGTMTASVPRSLILDSSGAQPYPGGQLTDFRARSHSVLEDLGQPKGAQLALALVPPPRVHDAMPDDGNGTTPFTVSLGLQQTGHARLRSDQPVRASNGEATTFVFRVEAANLGMEDDRFTLAASGVPANWQVRLSAPILEVPGNATVRIPVLVTTPFSHDHGSFASFQLEMASLTDPASVGRLELGIRYLAIPQPAGHHSTLYLHSQAYGNGEALDTVVPLLGGSTHGAYMNAQQEDGVDADKPVSPFVGQFASGAQPTQDFIWFIDLQPGLQLGLDFDLSRDGTLYFPIQTQAPLRGAVLKGQLMYWPPQEQGIEPKPPVVLGTIGPTAPAEIGGSQAFDFTVPFEPQPGGDYLPYRPGSAVVLQVNLTATLASPPLGPSLAPHLVPGGTLELPLFEYRDPVDQVFSAIADLELGSLSGQDLRVNPGEAALFEMQLTNHGDGARFEAVVQGVNEGWARLLGPAQFRADGHATVPIPVAVTVPAEARSGDYADLIVEVRRADDPNVRVLARIVATVDTSQDHPDAAQRIAELEGRLAAKGSPGASWLLAAAALAAAAFVRRRGA